MEEPDEESLKNVKSLLKQGLVFGKLNSGYKVFGERDFNPLTTSPGDKLFEKIKDFPEFRVCNEIFCTK
jgi:hypothetical protein